MKKKKNKNKNQISFSTKFIFQISPLLLAPSRIISIYRWRVIPYIFYGL